MNLQRFLTLALALAGCAAEDADVAPLDAPTPLTCEELLAQTDPAPGVSEVLLDGEFTTAGVTYLCPWADDGIHSGSLGTWSQTPRTLDGQRGAVARPRVPGVIAPCRWVPAVAARLSGDPDAGTCGSAGGAS